MIMGLLEIKETRSLERVFGLTLFGVVCHTYRSTETGSVTLFRGANRGHLGT